MAKGGMPESASGRLWSFIKRHRAITALLIIIAGLAIAFPIFYLATLGAACLESPGFCISKYDGRLVASEYYWQAEARPFAILAHRWTGRTLEVAINNTAGEELTMTGFAIGGGGRGPEGVYPKMQKKFQPGEMLEMAFIDMGECRKNADYGLNVAITYDSASASGQKQIGARNLIGYCR